MKIIRTLGERGMYFGAKEEVFDLASKLRKNPTKAEKVMWRILRNFRKSGFTFRRQHPIEFYIADFYCHKLKLVIEVDGEIHSEEEVHDHDEGRTGEMERFGITVLRFTNDQVLNEGDKILTKIASILSNMKSAERSSPSHFRRGGPDSYRERG